AARGQLIRQSLLESVLLSLLGTASGVFLAWWMIDLVVHYAPLQWARLEDTALDGKVLLFAMALCLLTTMLFGLIPAWGASQAAPLESLHAGGRASTDGLAARRVRTVLVSLEVALSTMLLNVAGLLLASWQRILNAPRGFATHNVVAVDLSVSNAT